jgi:hypothetical protein
MTGSISASAHANQAQTNEDGQEEAEPPIPRRAVGAGHDSLSAVTHTPNKETGQRVSVNELEADGSAKEIDDC